MWLRKDRSLHKPTHSSCSTQGTPVASLLAAEDATVTLCHSKTQNVEEIVCTSPHIWLCICVVLWLNTAWSSSTPDQAIRYPCCCYWKTRVCPRRLDQARSCYHWCWHECDFRCVQSSCGWGPSEASKSQRRKPSVTQRHITLPQVFDQFANN